VLAELMPLANARGVEISLAAESGLELRGEPAGLRALVGNLVDNGLRYTPAGGAVEVSVSRSGDALLLVVSDTGPGLTEEQRKLVFQRFYRVPGSPGEGSGLGLAITSAVVQRHAGSIELMPSESGGLRVEVRLPTHRSDRIEGNGSDSSLRGPQLPATRLSEKGSAGSVGS
jgi:signal transduction histidine kinase